MILREKTVYDYPKWSIRELMMNAIMHRDYRSTGPTMFYQFADRLEILNSGGLYGRVNRDNFPDENDYRNPIIADAMRTLGYVNRFGRGIGRVRAELVENGNGEPLFDTTQIGSFRVTVSWTKFASEDKSSQRGTESSQTAGESAQETAESSQRAGESSQTVAESTQEIERWIANALPTGIRSDARANMVEVMKLIHTNSTETAESMAAKIGISMRGVQKILATLQKLGLIERIGPDFGGHWEVVK
jgi:ATP-dependent DNA helicase RecG